MVSFGGGRVCKVILGVEVGVRGVGGMMIYDLGGDLCLFWHQFNIIFRNSYKVTLFRIQIVYRVISIGYQDNHEMKIIKK